jgi:D-lactate dehydrogenase
VEPGLILGEVNRLLAAYAKKNKLPIQYKMGPDPRCGTTNARK